MGIDVRGLLGRLPDAQRAASIVNGGLLGDPQRSYMYEFSVLGVDLGSILFNDLRFYAKTATIPQYAVDTIQHNFIGNKIIYNGKDVSSYSMNVTFWDDERLTVYKYFRTWMEKIKVNDDGRTVSKANYSSTVTIKLKDTTDLVTTLQINMINAFPIELGEIPLNYDGSDVIEIPMVFTFDKQEVV
jgi:hypothetical protein